MRVPCFPISLSGVVKSDISGDSRAMKPGFEMCRLAGGNSRILLPIGSHTFVSLHRWISFLSARKKDGGVSGRVDAGGWVGVLLQGSASQALTTFINIS